MKKMKKLFAMLLAFTMVLGMALTANAAYTAVSIPVDGASSTAKFAKLHLIEADNTTDTGWKFASDTIQKNFTDAFDILDAQEIIWKLIGNKDSSASLPTGVTAATDKQIADALANVKNGHTFADSDYGTTLMADEAGVFYIDARETGFNYSPMAAYVSFGYTNGVPSSLQCEGVVAKRQTEVIEKDATSVENFDEITEIKREETYTVSSVVPYLPTTDNNRIYKIIDELKGATYVSSTSGKVDVNVVVGEGTGKFEKDYVLDVTSITKGTSFTLDLSDDLLTEGTNKTAINKYANKTVTITYKAIVTDVIVGNDVYAGDGTTNGKDKFGSDHEDLYTGNITLTKYASDSDNNVLTDNAKLAGAKFKVYKLVNQNIKKWATFDANNKFNGWVDAESSATEVTTSDAAATLGQVKVSGLDSGTYWFKETVAPEGYSINETDVSAILALETGKGEAEAELTAVTTMIDTQLLALPSTGGIGTTIFTVAGCGIMIASAFFFLASRKKEN